MQRTHITIKQKPTPQPNTDGFPSWALSILKEKPFTTIYWLVLTFGGLLTYSFLFGTGYLPDLDWANTPALLLAIAFSGVLFVTTFSWLLMMPSFLLRPVWREINANPDNIPHTQNTNPALRQTKIWYALTSIAHCSLAFAVWMAIMKILSPSSWYYIVIPFAASILIFFFAGFRKMQWKLHIQFFIVWGVSWLPLFLLLFFLEKETDGITIFTLWAAVVTINTMLAANENRAQYWLSVIIAGVFLTFYFGFIPGIAKNPSQAAFAAYHLGEIESATLAITKQACDEINWFESSKCFPYGGGGVVSNVKIISRIGSEFVLELTPKPTNVPNSKNKKVTEITTPRVMLKKDQIQAWSYNQVSHQEKNDPKDQTTAPLPSPSAPK